MWSIIVARLLKTNILKLLMLLLELMLSYLLLLLIKVGDSDWRLRISTECISRLRVLHTAIGCLRQVFKGIRYELLVVLLLCLLESCKCGVQAIYRAECQATTPSTLR